MRAIVLLVLASSSSYCGGDELFTILDESVDGIKDCREEGIETCQTVKVNLDVLRGRAGDIDDPEIGEFQKLPTVLGNGDKESPWKMPRLMLIADVVTCASPTVNVILVHQNGMQRRRQLMIAPWNRYISSMRIIHS